MKNRKGRPQFADPPFAGLVVDRTHLNHYAERIAESHIRSVVDEWRPLTDYHYMMVLFDTKKDIGIARLIRAGQLVNTVINTIDDLLKGEWCQWTLYLDRKNFSLFNKALDMQSDVEIAPRDSANPNTTLH